MAKLGQNHGMDTCSWNSFSSMLIDFSERKESQELVVFVTQLDILGLVTRWNSSHGTENSVVLLDRNDLESFRLFPETL